MAETTARSKTVPATPDVITSAIAADVIIGELLQWRAELERRSHEQNTSLLDARRFRAIDFTVRQFAALHELEV